MVCTEPCQQRGVPTAGPLVVLHGGRDDVRRPIPHPLSAKFSAPVGTPRVHLVAPTIPLKGGGPQGAQTHGGGPTAAGANPDSYRVLNASPPPLWDRKRSCTPVALNTKNPRAFPPLWLPHPFVGDATTATAITTLTERTPATHPNADAACVEKFPFYPSAQAK